MLSNRYIYNALTRTSNLVSDAREVIEETSEEEFEDDETLDLVYDEAIEISNALYDIEVKVLKLKRELSKRKLV